MFNGQWQLKFKAAEFKDNEDPRQRLLQESANSSEAKPATDESSAGGKERSGTVSWLAGGRDATESTRHGIYPIFKKYGSK